MARLSLRVDAGRFRWTVLLPLAILFLGSHSLQAQGGPDAIASVCPDSSAFIQYDKEAVPLNLLEILCRICYPQALKDAGIDPGKLVVRILVDENGRYVRHYVVKETHQLLYAEIRPLIPEILWQAAEKNGKPVGSWVTLPFQFCFPH